VRDLASFVAIRCSKPGAVVVSDTSSVSFVQLILCYGVGCCHHSSARPGSRFLTDQ